LGDSNVRGEKLILGDVSGMLLDYKESNYSSSITSSALSDTENMGEEEGKGKEKLRFIFAPCECAHPHHHPHRPMLPEPAHTWSSVVDMPMPVVVRDVADIV
jgi:hypothetical protein